MNHRVCKIALLSVSVVLLAALPVMAATRVLSVQPRTQEKTNWCWNACTQMILRYYDRHFAEQCEIAELARSINQALFGNTPCCLNPDQGCNATNGLFGNPQDVKELLRYHMVPSSEADESLTYAQTKGFIDIGRPLIVGWIWGKFNQFGHAIVIRGYADAGSSPQVRSDSLHFVNPWPGEGALTWSYGNVVSHTEPAGTVSWEQTLILYHPMITQEVSLYDGSGYEGSSTTVPWDVPNLGWFNDKCSSAKVRGFPWILYEHADYGGRSWGLTPRDYSNAAAWSGLDNVLSSHRMVPEADSEKAVILFQDTNFRGSYVVLNSDEFDLRLQNFSDKASSAIVVSGIWRLYRDIGKSGTQYALTSFGGPNRDGFYPTFGDWGGNNDEISSVEWISEELDPIILYQHSDLKGRAVALHKNDNPNWLANLTNVGFNDQVSSIKTYGDTWIVYQHANQNTTGRSHVLNANTWYREPAAWGGNNDEISSLIYVPTGDWF